MASKGERRDFTDQFVFLVEDCDRDLVCEGLRDGCQCNGGGLMVVDGWDVFRFDDIKGFDGQAREWREDADGVEKKADYVFLGEPAEFNAVVESPIE